jgi:hypothetical protein
MGTILLAPQITSRIHRTVWGHLYVVQVAKTEPDDRVAEKAVEPIPSRNRNLRGHLFVARSIRVARTEPTNDQRVEKAVDAQAVKIVADQSVMNRRMIPFLPARGISSLYRRV